ncbi:MAG TPA: DUF1508 domain-containing protein [Candidatus Limnocylindrales bacterium]
MTGRFELYTDVRGQWRFRLKTADGQIVCVGESYRTKGAALEVIEKVRQHADAEVVELDGVGKSG